MHDTSGSATRIVLFARLAIVAAVGYQLLLIALILVRPEIDPARKLLILTGLLPSAGFVIFAILVATVTPSEGWPPRLMFLTYTGWIIAVATKNVGVRVPLTGVS